MRTGGQDYGAPGAHHAQKEEAAKANRPNRPEAYPPSLTLNPDRLQLVSEDPPHPLPVERDPSDKSEL